MSPPTKPMLFVLRHEARDHAGKRADLAVRSTSTTSTLSSVARSRRGRVVGSALVMRKLARRGDDSAAFGDDVGPRRRQNWVAGGDDEVDALVGVGLGEPSAACGGGGVLLAARGSASSPSSRRRRPLQRRRSGAWAQPPSWRRAGDDEGDLAAAAWPRGWSEPVGAASRRSHRGQRATARLHAVAAAAPSLTACAARASLRFILMDLPLPGFALVRTEGRDAAESGPPARLKLSPTPGRSRT